MTDVVVPEGKADAEEFRQQRLRLRAKRLVLVFGPAYGIMMYSIMKLAGMFNTPRKGPYSFLFGDMHNWPWYMGHVWPIDLLMVSVGSMLMMYIVLVGVVGDKEPVGVWGWTKYGLGIFSAIGSFGLILGTMLGGWYMGIEGFFALGFMMTALVVALLAAAAVMLGLGYTFMWIGKALWRGVSTTTADSKWTGKALWGRIQFTFLGRKVTAIQSYFSADDFEQK